MSTHENTSQSRDVYQKVTDAIVNAIEAGVPHALGGSAGQGIQPDQRVHG
jgi:hypothetical protein